MIADMLEAEGFPTQIIEEAGPGGFEGISGMVSGDSQRGLEVWVKDAAHIEPAKKWIEIEMSETTAARPSKQERTGTVAAECEECRKSSDWPASEMGRTQVCPHCEAYMDVPDPDDDWNDREFSGENESEE